MQVMWSTCCYLVAFAVWHVPPKASSNFFTNIILHRRVLFLPLAIGVYLICTSDLSFCVIMCIWSPQLTYRVSQLLPTIDEWWLWRVSFLCRCSHCHCRAAPGQSASDSAIWPSIMPYRPKRRRYGACATRLCVRPTVRLSRIPSSVWRRKSSWTPEVDE